MAKTHYFPSDQVHFTWDAGNAPVLTVDSGDTVVVHTRDVSDNQIGPDSDVERHRRPRLGPRLPARRARSPSTARSPATRSPSRSSTSTRRAGAGRRSCPGSGCCADDFPDAYLRIFDLSDGDVDALPRGHRDPARRRSSGTMGVCPAGASAQPVMPPGHVRRQHGHAPARRAARRCTCPSRSRARCSSCGDAHGCPGRRRGLRDRPRGADVRRACASRCEKDRSIPAPQYRPRGPLTPRVDDGALVRDDRRRPRPLRRRPGRGARDGRPPRARPRPLAARTPTCSAACASTCGSRRSSTPASTSSARCCRWRSSPTRRLAG